MTYLLLASVVLSIIVSRMRGGKLSRLGEVTFRLWWIVPLIALAQLVLVRALHSSGRLILYHPRPLFMILSYIVLGAVIWLNRRLPGMRLVLAGTVLNLIAIAANGGYMPITPEALAQIGAGEKAFQIPAGSIVFGSKDVLLPAEQARLWVLGDVLVIPEPFPWPTAMSVGDVALAVGVFLFVLRTTQPPTHAGDQLCGQGHEQISANIKAPRGGNQKNGKLFA